MSTVSAFAAALVLQVAIVSSAIGQVNVVPTTVGQSTVASGAAIGASATSGSAGSGAGLAAVKVAGPVLESAMASRATRRLAVRTAKLFARRVLGARQFACLNNIAIRESGWDPFDLNRQSGAYGIPQALPGSKMASAGRDWRYNPTTQVRWMISYVRARYGSACRAWAFWQRHSWY